MWALIALSIVSFAHILDRAWALRRARVTPPALMDALGRADAAELRSVCFTYPSPLARLVLAVLDHLNWAKEETVSALEVQARQEVARMERGMVVIEIIVGIAPLLGLVGTIYAIIPIFGEFGKSVAGDNSVVAQGIAHALNKTLAGLMVAIPSLAAWSYFNKRVETLALDMEGLCDGLVRRHYLNARAETPARPSKP
jgi:biopolymer transport protein ExbB